MAGKLLPKLITPGRINQLPVRYNIETLLFLCIFIAVLVAVASILGILFYNDLYISEENINTFVPNDFANLLTGLPLLLISLMLIIRGKLPGLIFLPAALFYFIYVYFPYVFLSLGYLFIPHLLIFSLCIYILTALMVSIDRDSIKKLIPVRFPFRTLGGILIASGILIIIRQTVLVVIAIINKSTFDIHLTSLWIDDLALGSPVMITGGILLWRKKALGYIVGPGLYIVMGALSFGLIPYILIQSQLKKTSVDISSIIILLIMSALCVIPFILLSRQTYKNTAQPDRSSLKLR